MHLANAPHVNECRTGQEAIARARESEEKRRQMFGLNPKPRFKPKPISECVKKSPVPAQIAREADPRLPSTPFPRIIHIQKACCKYFDMPMTDVLSGRRFKSIVLVRHVAMYLAKSLTPHSLPEIGRRFGGKDHTSVMHAVRRIERLKSSDQNICDAIEKLSAALIVPTAYP